MFSHRKKCLCDLFRFEYFLTILLHTGDAVFNKTRLTSPDCNMIVRFDFANDMKNVTELVVLIQYGRQPSSDDFDVKVRISHTEVS